MCVTAASRYSAVLCSESTSHPDTLTATDSSRQPWVLASLLQRPPSMSEVVSSSPGGTVLVRRLHDVHTVTHCQLCYSQPVAPLQLKLVTV